MTESKNQLWCQSETCEEPIEDDDDVVWENYQQGEVYHKECHTTSERDPRDFEAGELVTADDLPENEILNSGKPEGIDYNLIVVMNDNICIEMKQAFEVTAVYESTADEPVGEVLSGEPR